MRQVREVLRLKFVGGVPTREIALGLAWQRRQCGRRLSTSALSA